MSQMKGLPREPRVRYHFTREEFDFFFQWIVGGQTHGGAEAGECFYAASKMQEGDAESWIREWNGLAERVQARAEASQAKGHRVSARESYLRAYTYYRSPLVFISPVHEPERYLKQYRTAQACFQAAVPLLDHPFEPFELPYKGKVLPAYMLKPDASDQPRKTLIMLGGTDTFVEDLYFYIGPAAIKRGYNLVIIDLPGQGVLPFEGLTWPTESEVPIGMLVDYLLSRSDIDSEKLAIFGLSGGGYLAPRAVTREKRIKACVASNIILNISVLWNDRLVELHRRAQRSLVGRAILELAKRRRRTFFTMVDTYLWRWGVRSVPELVEASRQQQLDPTQITCPTLNMLSDQEYSQSESVHRWAHMCAQLIGHPVRPMVVVPQNEGGDGHGIGTNLSLMSQIVFDWLDEVLNGTALIGCSVTSGQQSSSTNGQPASVEV